MDALTLVVPSVRYADQIAQYKSEFIAAGDVMAGCASLDAADSVEAWLEDIRANGSEATVREGLVPATTYLCVREEDNLLVGMIDIRHRLNDFLRNVGGHIGYSVRPGERRKGYAKEMLRQALLLCPALKLSRVLITCSKQNTGSAKTIQANGGVLENEVPDGDTLKQRYWIAIG